MGDRVRICRVISRLNVGGPARHVILLAEGLDPVRFETTLVVGTPGAAEGRLDDLARGRGVHLVRIPELGREIRPWRDVVALAKLWKLFREQGPDIVHTHAAKGGALGRVAAWLGRVPVRVHTYHGHIFHGYFSPMKMRIFLWIERLLARITTRILVLSEGQRREILGLGIGRPEQVTVVPPALALDGAEDRQEAHDALCRELGIPAGSQLVGAVGRLVPIKDHATFLRAVAIVAPKSPAAHFLLVGGGELEPELRAQAGGRGLAGRVHFLGWRQDLARIYPAIDLLVFSSRNEGTPAALIEGMAAATPAVATRVGGIPEMLALAPDGPEVEPGGPGGRRIQFPGAPRAAAKPAAPLQLVSSPGMEAAGILVAPGDAEAMAEAILLLLGDEGLRHRMGMAARERALERWDPRDLLRRIEELYVALLQAKGGEIPCAPS